MPSFWQVIGVGAMGGLGTLTRLGTNQLTAFLLGGHYPWGTTCSNLCGSFLFGVVTALFLTGKISEPYKLILLTGFMGGFTTFSAFAFEMSQFLEKQQYLLAFLHLSVQNLLGIAAVFFGLWLGKFWQ